MRANRTTTTPAYGPHPCVLCDFPATACRIGTCDLAKAASSPLLPVERLDRRQQAAEARDLAGWAGAA